MDSPANRAYGAALTESFPTKQAAYLTRLTPRILQIWEESGVLEAEWLPGQGRGGAVRVFAWDELLIGSVIREAKHRQAVGRHKQMKQLASTLRKRLPYGRYVVCLPTGVSVVDTAQEVVNLAIHARAYFTLMDLVEMRQELQRRLVTMPE